MRRSTPTITAATAARAAIVPRAWPLHRQVVRDEHAVQTQFPAREPHRIRREASGAVRIYQGTPGDQP